MLNPKLVNQQQLTDEDIDKLEMLHHIKKCMHSISIEDLPIPPKGYVKAMEDLEYQMQELWGFERNSAYHQHWFRDPKCSCPTLDNLDLIGIDRRIKSLSCNLHGDNIENN